MASTELRVAAQQAQPKALRLADALEISSNHGMRREAATELRRLHAERTAADGVINDLAAKVRGLQTQSGALLEALELGYDSAKAGADQYHAAMAGYRPQRHAEMDAEVQQIAAAITALKAALAEPPDSTKPVVERNFCPRCGKRTNGIHTCTPPAPLTDEVIADLWHQNGGFHHHFARAIERWLRGHA